MLISLTGRPARTCIRKLANVRRRQLTRSPCSCVAFRSIAQWQNLRSLIRTFSALSTDSTDVGGLRRLLTEEETELLEEQRALTEKARTLASQLESINVRNYIHTFLSDVLPDAEDYSTFSIVVAGEFNSGKSSLINALLGKKLLETGALPTTDSITIISYGSSNDMQHNVGGHGVVLHQVSSVPLLKDLTLVDTPGTNAVILDHTQRTIKLLPTADLILFVTSADRPFPESERNLLQSIQEYRKNIVVVINKMDILETSGGNYGEEEKRRVIDFVAGHASELLGARPIVIPISARDAMSAKISYKDRTDQSAVWQRSNFSSLETFLKEELTTETKIKSKLTNPIGVTEGMISECVRVLREQEEEHKEDIATLNLLKSQYNGWVKSVDSEVVGLRKEIGDLFSEQEKRGNALLTSMSFVDRYLWSIDNERLDMEWNKTSTTGRGSSQGIEDAVLDIIREIADLLATRARAQGQAVIEYLGRRPSMKSQSLVGSVTASSRFEDIRTNLEEKMSKTATNIIRNNTSIEAPDNFLASIRKTAYFSASLNLAALGSATAAALGAVDVVPGVASCAAFVAASAAIVLQGDQRAKSEYCSAWKAEQEKLDGELDLICSKELHKVHKRILDGVAPYTIYVETERERIQTSIEECESIMAAAQALRSRVNKLRHQ